MNTLVVSLYAASGATVLFGAVKGLTAAFQHGMAEAKNAFVACVAGLGVLGGLAATVPLSKALHPPPPALSHSAKMKGLAEQIEEERSRILSLQDDLAAATGEANREYKDLNARRAALVATDEAAVHQFNLDAAAYRKQLLRLKQLRKQIDTASAGVDDLLSQRSEEAAKKEVVIYSTSWCPACKAARQYMDSKGISYRDVDVENSPYGAAEYRQEGGTGAVPLIVVGDKKMVGFSSTELDSML